jgi:hypothetical protein
MPTDCFHHAFHAKQSGACAFRESPFKTKRLAMLWTLTESRVRRSLCPVLLKHIDPGSFWRRSRPEACHAAQALIQG